jgi:phosphate-selective porin OprO/OprP
MKLLISALALTSLLAAPTTRAEEPPPTGAEETGVPADGKDDEAPPDEEEDEFKPIEWGPKGLDIRSRDGNYRAHIDWRAQFRFTQSNLGEALVPNPETREGEFVINRARFKMGGHAYRPWLVYYLEYDLVTPALLDLRFTLKPSDAFQFRFGQWKVPYNRERVDSSGKQQFVERSIVNPFFTVDRQQGLLVYGRLWEGRRADSWYNLGVNSATGRGGRGSVERPMLLGRWQWNILKRDLPFSQSDFGYRKKAAASIAVAGATWQGPYTSFSTQGGGEHPGLPIGQEDTYKVRQAMVETALQGHGFSFQQEYHWKRVEDTLNASVTDLEGGYLQVGYFLHALIARFPRPLELAVRVARVDPERIVRDDLIRELSVGANWFFDGHRNKLTLDLSFLDREAAPPGERQETRLRLQWDVSF